MNSLSNTVVVSVSKFVKRMRRSLTAFSGSSPEALMLSANSSAALKRTSAQRGLGNPKIPEEMAGIATDSKPNLHAQISVLLMQEYKSSSSFLRPYIFIIFKILHCSKQALQHG